MKQVQLTDAQMVFLQSTIRDSFPQYETQITTLGEMPTLVIGFDLGTSGEYKLITVFSREAWILFNEPLEPTHFRLAVRLIRLVEDEFEIALSVADMADTAVPA